MTKTCKMGRIKDKKRMERNFLKKIMKNGGKRLKWNLKKKKSIVNAKKNEKKKNGIKLNTKIIK